MPTAREVQRAVEGSDLLFRILPAWSNGILRTAPTEGGRPEEDEEGWEAALGRRPLGHLDEVCYVPVWKSIVSWKPMTI